MVFKISFFWLIHYYQQAEAGTTLLSHDGLMWSLIPHKRFLTQNMLGLPSFNRQTELKATSLILSSKATLDTITITCQDEHSEATHIQHQKVSINTYCLNYYCRLIFEKLLVTASLRFFFLL